MRLPTLFGRSASARERPPSDLKNVRHSSRVQRLSFRKQLRTFMCFTTEEKLSQGGSGDKRRRKRGSLSQRLRLTESSEDQCSSLEVMSRLVLRPSTCPPSALATVTEAEVVRPKPGGEAAGGRVCGEPSSLTLSSLDEDQLNAYLKVMFERCAAEAPGAAEQSCQQATSAATASAGEQFANAEGLTAPIPAEENAEVVASQTTTGESQRRARKPTLRECEELIRRHEKMFGPIVSSRPARYSAPAPDSSTGSAELPAAPLSHWLHQTGSALPEPCLPLVPDTTYLSIPQDRAAPADPDWDAWRRHFSSGPGGVWRIVARDAPEREAETVPDATPPADARPRRLFGALRDRCSALFRHEEKAREEETAAVGDTLSASATGGAKDDEDAKDFSEKILSETKAEEIVKGMKEEEVVPCTTSQDLCPVIQPPRHDPESYRDGSFGDWRRFFRWRGSERSTSETSLDDSWVTITGTMEVPLSCVEQHVRRDWLPASLWWGVSPLLEAVLSAVPDAADTARLAALLAWLRPLSRRLAHAGLARLVARLDRRRQPADREAAWLTRPELPRLFSAAGLGPADMTRWVLRVPQDREDDAVPLRSQTEPGELVEEGELRPDGLVALAEAGQQDAAGDGREEQLKIGIAEGKTGFASWDQELTPHTTPRAKFFEQLMGNSASDPIVELSTAQRDITRSTSQKDAIDHIVLKQTNTSCIETPASQFSTGWGVASNTEQTYDANCESLESQTISFILSENMAMPLCSDVCTFLLPEHADHDRVLAKAESAPSEAYDTYETKQWRDLGANQSEETPPAGSDGDLPSQSHGCTAPLTDPDKSSGADPVGAFDSETELGAHLALRLAESSASASTYSYDSQLRNSSVRPIDSEVDIAQVLHEQSGYATFGDTAAPVGAGYQSLPLHEVDSETELGLALPLTDSARPLSAVAHRQVTAYDSEVDMAALVASLHGADSETEMGERLRRLAGRPVTPPPSEASPRDEAETAAGAARGRFDAAFPAAGGEVRREFSSELPPVPERAASSDSMTRLPAAPVQVDSETEMGVVLRLFEQGLLSSRYFAGVPLSDDLGAELTRLGSSDSDINICLPEGHPERGADQAGQEAAHERCFGECVPGQAGSHAHTGEGVSPHLSINEIYDASKELSRKVVRKALFVLGGAPSPPPPLARTGSSPFGPSSGLDGIELESEACPDGGEPRGAAGTCDPGRVIPEVSLTTSDGSFVVLFPSRPAGTTDTADYYETDEGLVVRLEKRQPVAESRGFQPAEAGLSLSECELSSARRLRAGRCADAALRRRSPSPRTRASDEGGLRVLYRAEGAEPWQPVSPEGLSGLALAPTDPELAAVRWRKNSRGEDGDPEAWSAGEATAPPPPAESQSQTELGKTKPAPPPPVGANSWC